MQVGDERNVVLIIVTIRPIFHRVVEREVEHIALLQLQRRCRKRGRQCRPIDGKLISQCVVHQHDWVRANGGSQLVVVEIVI